MGKIPMSIPLPIGMNAIAETVAPERKFPLSEFAVLSRQPCAKCQVPSSSVPCYEAAGAIVKKGGEHPANPI
jgi:hypothetical protein